MWSSLLQRLFNISKAKANDALDRAEDPVQMIKLATVELEQAIAQATKALSVAMANQKKLERDHEQFRLESLGWYQKAAAAMQNGNEALAEKALAQKALSDKKETEYRLLAERAGAAVNQLQEQLDDYKAKLQEVKTKQSIYLAKAESAKAHKQIAQTLSGLNGSALANMEKYENAINQMEAEAESLTQINSDKSKLEKEFRQLETSVSVQSDLEKLRLDVAQQKQLKEQQRMADLNRKFEELNQGTQTHHLKPLPPAAPEPKALPPSPAEELKKKMDDFFK